MKNIKLLSLTLLALLFTFSSCNKDNDPKPKTNKELLTAKTWKVSKVKEDGHDVTNEPDVAYIKNMRLAFKSDGTYTMTTSGDSGNGVWEFANNESKLVLDEGTDEEQRLDIAELKDNLLKFEITESYIDHNGDIQTVIIELEMVYAE